MQRAPQGHTDACRDRIVGILKRRPEFKRRLERAEDIRDAKLARYIEQQDRIHVQDDVMGAPLCIRGQTVAGGGGGLGVPEQAEGTRISSHVVAGSSTDPLAQSTAQANSTSGQQQVSAHQSGGTRGAGQVNTSRAGARPADNTLDQEQAPQAKRLRQEGDDIDMCELVQRGRHGRHQGRRDDEGRHRTTR